MYGILIIVNLKNKINFMCKALIIGAGGVGTVVAQKIAANPIFFGRDAGQPNKKRSVMPLLRQSAGTG